VQVFNGGEGGGCIWLGNSMAMAVWQMIGGVLRLPKQHEHTDDDLFSESFHECTSFLLVWSGEKT